MCTYLTYQLNFEEGDLASYRVHSKTISADSSGRSNHLDKSTQIEFQ